MLLQAKQVTSGSMLHQLLRVGLIGLLSEGLLGCAPLWPHMIHSTDLRTKSGDDCATTMTTPAQFQCISASIGELEYIKYKIQTYNRGSAYFATAAGTYAGFKATRAHPNTALLKNVALGAAALVGFDQVIGSDKQMTVVDAGRGALTCLQEAALALKNAGVGEPRANAVMGRLYVAAALTTPDRIKQASVQATLLPTLVDTLKKSAIGDSNATTQFLMTMTGVIYNGLAADDAYKSATQLSDPQIAQLMQSALFDIRWETASQLGSAHPNLSKLFSDQQSAVTSLAKNLADAEKKQDDAANAIRAFEAREPQPPEQTPAQKAMQDCVTKISPPG